ncbi:MAG: cation transporter, partial [Candidatus Kapaibacteriota bacterium]
MHHHDHDHPHDHHHDHHDIRPLRIAMAITTSILVLQIVGGVVSGSLALLSDAGHVFVDLGSLLIAYTGLHLA